MANRTLTLELPEELVSLLGTPEEVAVKATELLVLELLREARISQGTAARLLGVTRGRMLDLMAAHQIPSGAESVEEQREEVHDLRRFLKGA